MKRLALVVMLLLAACGEQQIGETQPASSQASDVIDQLSRADGAACAHPAVAGTFHDIVFDNWNHFSEWSDSQLAEFREGMDRGINQITLTSVDPATDRVRCQGTYFATWQGNGADNIVNYDVMPALDSDDFIVEIHDIKPAHQAFRQAWFEYYRLNIKPALDAENARAQTLESYAHNGANCASVEGDLSGDYRELYEFVLSGTPPPETPEQEVAYACFKRMAERAPVERNFSGE